MPDVVLVDEDEEDGRPLMGMQCDDGLIVGVLQQHGMAASGRRADELGLVDEREAAGGGRTAYVDASLDGTFNAVVMECPVCSVGEMMIKQGAGQWSAQCSLLPDCSFTIPLPGCVTSVAVEGACLACSLRTRSDVRQLSLRFRPGTALGLLPAGEDALRGVCIAGCDNRLATLYT